MKTTAELKRLLRQETPEILFSSEFEPETPGSYLKTLLQERNLKPMDMVRRCNLDRSYAYQLLNGTRIPSRNLILLIALELGFTENQVQRLLNLAERPALFVHRRRDAVILYGLMHDLGVEGTAALLASLEEEGLT